MQDADVILVEPSYYMDSVYSYFAKFVGAENMTILSMVMKKHCPDYYDTLETICDGVKFHPFNMFLCRKSLFDEYAEWIFSILLNFMPSHSLDGLVEKTVVVTLALESPIANSHFAQHLGFVIVAGNPLAHIAHALKVGLFALPDGGAGVYPHHIAVVMSAQVKGPAEIVRTR